MVNFIFNHIFYYLYIYIYLDFQPSQIIFISLLINYQCGGLQALYTTLKFLVELVLFNGSLVKLLL